MKTIKTTHKETKGSDPETVFWLPLIDANFSASQHERDVKGIPRAMLEWVDKLFSPSLQEVKWIPVTVENVHEDYNRTIYRGYRTYPEHVLQNPLVIRGRELGEIEGVVRQWNQCEVRPTKSVWWKGSYSRPLSSGEEKKLAEWFSSTLILETTPVLIYELRVRAKNRAIKDTRNFLREKSTEAQNALSAIMGDKALQPQ